MGSTQNLERPLPLSPWKGLALPQQHSLTVPPLPWVWLLWEATPTETNLSVQSWL